MSSIFFKVLIFLFSKIISPEVGLRRFNINLASVVLPHPDSPTIPTDSPFLILKDT